MPKFFGFGSSLRSGACACAPVVGFGSSPRAGACECASLLGLDRLSAQVRVGATIFLRLVYWLMVNA